MMITWEVSEMNQYVTGTVIKELREKNHMTQAELAEKLCVSANSATFQILCVSGLRKHST